MKDLQKSGGDSSPFLVPPPAPVSPIENNGREPEKSDVESLHPPPVLNAIFHFLKKLFLPFFRPDRRNEYPARQVDLAEHLQNFSSQLLVLCRADCSHTLQYLERMSELWHILEQDCNLIDPYEKKLFPSSEKIKKLLYEIGSYSLEEGFPLSHYLSRHAGSDWIPFPFMNILQTLHEEYQKNPTSSSLTLWISQIDTVLKESSSQATD